MDHVDRYHRQRLLPAWSDAAQARLGAGSALLVGCGALGCAIADALVRAGIGRLRLVDRDVVELTNLHRQILFTESDADQGLPKAHAAAARLEQVNAQVTLEPHVADCTAANVLRLAEGMDVILDGTDNYQTRFLLNDVAVQRGLPLIYGGAVGTGGSVAAILPRSDTAPWVDSPGPTPCLRCLIGDPPPPGAMPTCDTVGVLGALPVIIGSLQAVDAMKVLAGQFSALTRGVRQIDPWSGRAAMVGFDEALDPDCPCCARRRFDLLSSDTRGHAVSLCGRNAVQVGPSPLARGADAAAVGRDEDDQADEVVDLRRVASRLGANAEASVTAFALRATLHDAGGPFLLTLFPDGRAIIKGTTDPAVARSLYSRYIGA